MSTTKVPVLDIVQKQLSVEIVIEMDNVDYEGPSIGHCPLNTMDNVDSEKASIGHCPKYAFRK